MRERVEQRPDQIDYRLLLAQAAMAKQDYDDAVLHYGVIIEVVPEDADALAFYAQALYLKNDRQINAEVASYLDQSLQINPYQTTALGLLGINAFTQEDFEQAIEYWQKLLEVLEPGSSKAQMIEAGLVEARKKVAQNNQQIAQVEKEKAEADAKGIKVSVDIIDHLKSEPDDLTVFVYAKASKGPGMPLAVVKLRLDMLPATVMLTDAMAMMPSLKLSSFDEVKIGARLSYANNPTPQRGDWQAETEPMLWRKTNGVNLLISDQVR